jgi:hypothetical protein
MMMRLADQCARAVENNPSQKPLLADMIDRFQVLGNQMEEIYIHGRPIEFPEDDGVHLMEGVEEFDETNVPEEVVEAYRNAGMELQVRPNVIES